MENEKYYAQQQYNQQDQHYQGEIPFNYDQDGYPAHRLSYVINERLSDVMVNAGVHQCQQILSMPDLLDEIKKPVLMLLKKYTNQKKILEKPPLGDTMYQNYIKNKYDVEKIKALFTWGTQITKNNEDNFKN